jgi:hypothetical protein
LRTLPFTPNKDHTADTKTLTVQLYGHTTVATASGSTSRVNPALWVGGAGAEGASGRTGTLGTFNAGAIFTPAAKDANLRFYPTDWAALEPSGSAGSGILAFTMANSKWGQTCENAASHVNCLWCNTGTLTSGGSNYNYVSSGQGTGADPAVAGAAEGTAFTGGATGDILVFKSKSITATSGGDGRMAMVDTTARDFIVHSQSSGKVNQDGTGETGLAATAMEGKCENIRPWNMDWVFSQGANADTFFAMPSHWSAIRGRGGFGAGNTNQFLMQRFFQMKTSADTDFFSAMINHYVYPGANQLPSGGLKVLPSMPLWVSENKADQDFSGLSGVKGLQYMNDGTEALNTFKIYIAATETPADRFFGFPMPTGTPFMKATGDNEIEVITNRANGGAGVKCYMYGNENGLGFCNKVDNAANWAYERLLQFRDMNFMVCDIGTTAAATGGEIVVVPFRMTNNIDSAITW